MKTFATWKIQRGTTLGLVEQLLGSHKISGAFLTQARFQAFNLLGLLIITLWCLSPLGSQASLRVVSIKPNYLRNSVDLTTLNAFTAYKYGVGENVGQAATVIIGPFAAALFSANLLKDRNQDLWGNIRLPSIERLTHNESIAWVDIADPTNVDYPSLVGLPVAGLPRENTTFTLVGSYLNIECDTFNTAGNVSTNYTSLKPGGSTDDFWNADTSSTFFTIAISQSFQDILVTSNGTRDPRRLIWDSPGTHAECKFYTTYVDVNISCTSNVCSSTSIRRSPQPPRDRNWTVFDLINTINVDGFFATFNHSFPDVGFAATQSPIVEYFTSPYNTVSPNDVGKVYSVGKEIFELRLAQLLNSQLLLGIDSPSLTGNFNATSTDVGITPVALLGTQFTEQDLVHCDRAWLGILVAASLTLFFIAAVAAILRLITLVPDVLGTLSLAMLDNRCRTVMGNTAWTNDERVVTLKGIRVQLGDVQPDADVGRIGLAAPVEEEGVKEVRRGRYFH